MLNVILVACLGLIIGSFLNVVIARYPAMLLRRWQAECREFLALPTPLPDYPAVNLATPASQCPHCRKRLACWHNIPVVSYLLLRGHCGFCQQSISFQYPLVEIVTALATLAVFYQYGWSPETGAAWLLTWGLVALSGIDWKAQLLPDDLTLALIWIGLMVNTFSLFTPLAHSVWGAVGSYILLWGIAELFRRIRRKPGMGHGDFKMLAMLGAWMGGIAALHILMLAIFLSLLVNLGLLLFKKVHYDQPLPFGPWLAIAGWIILMLNPWINHWSLQWL